MLRKSLVLLVAFSLIGTVPAFAGGFGNPSNVAKSVSKGVGKATEQAKKAGKSTSEETKRAVKSVKNAVRGRVIIRVKNATDGEISVSSNVGKKSVNVAPHEAYFYKRANIGDNVKIYVNGKTLRNLGPLFKNRYDLVYHESGDS